MNAITKIRATTTKLFQPVNNGSCKVDGCEYLAGYCDSPENTILGTKIEIEFAGKSLEALFKPEKPEGVIFEALEFCAGNVDINLLNQEGKKKMARNVENWLEEQVRSSECIDSQEYLANAIEEEFELLVA